MTGCRFKDHARFTSKAQADYVAEDLGRAERGSWRVEHCAMGPHDPDHWHALETCPPDAACGHCSWCHDEMADALLRDGELDGWVMGPKCRDLASVGMLPGSPSGRRLPPEVAHA